MIKNTYRLEDGIAIFTITRRNGDIFEVKIDESQLYKIDNLNKSIHVSWHSEIDNYYAEICDYLGLINGKPKYRTILLHRLVADANDNEYVDHINASETLDNTLKNLRKTSNSDNNKNRKGIQKNNKSGYRNVCWVYNKWIVQLQIEGRNTKLGEFDDVHEAGKFAADMREKYYGEFAGKG